MPHGGTPPGGSRLDYTRGVRLNRNPGLLLGLLGWLALYALPALRGQTLAARDLGATAGPWRTAWAFEVANGSLPLWDPSSSGGRLMLANPNAMAVYPGTLLFLATKPELAVVLHLAAHHLLLVLGLYRLARASGAGRRAAGLAAAISASTGLAWSSLTFLNISASLAWAPWVLSAVARRPRDADQARRRVVRAGVFQAMCVLGGEPVTATLVALVAAALAVLEWQRRSVWVVLGLPVLAATAAAPLLVPFLVSLPYTARGALSATPGALTADVLAPGRWVELLLPNLLGPPLADQDAGFWAAASFPWQRYFPLVFVGSMPLVLGLAALHRRRRLRSWLLVSTVGWALVFAIGLPGVGTWLESLPGLDTVRYGIKLMVVPYLCLPGVLAVGWEELVARWRPRSRRATRIFTVSLLAVVSALGWSPAGRDAVRTLLGRVYPASADALREVAPQTMGRAVLRDGAALLLPMAGLAAFGPHVGVVAVTALAGNAFQARPAWLPSPSIRWSSPPPLVATLPPHPVIAVFVRRGRPNAPLEEAQLERFWAARAALYPEYGVRWGVGYVLTRGPDGLEPARAELMARYASTLPIDAQARLAASLGANAVVAPAPLSGWACVEVEGVWSCSAPSFAPDAYVARRALPAQGLEATAWTLGGTGFRPGIDVVVESAGAVPSLSDGRVVERAGAPHRRRFHVEVEGHTILVVRQNFMECWTGSLDGHPVRPFPVNGSMLGLDIPPGSHDVELAIDRRPYAVGGLGPLVTLLLAFVLLRVPTRRRDTATPAEDAETTAPASSQTSR